MLVTSLLPPCLNFVIAPYYRGDDAPNDCWCAHPSQNHIQLSPAGAAWSSVSHLMPKT